MSGAYSLDLREKVISAYKTKKFTQLEISNFFGIGTSTIGRWIKKYKTTGNLLPDTINNGRKPKIDSVGLLTIEQEVKKNNAITLSELSDIYFKKHNVKVGRSILSRALIKLNLRRKKLSTYSSQKDDIKNKKKEKNILK